MTIRPATRDDFDALCSIDSIAERDAARRHRILAWLRSAECHIAESNRTVAAYGVLTDQFFGYPFIEMIMVGEKHRRKGLGEELVRHFQSKTTGAKLFSSTNASNGPMQTLFGKLGFVQSGRIDNLDEGDPELVFLYRRNPGL
jgi:ribosomal protein S18 acetylase RimI-like enzyme